MARRSSQPRELVRLSPLQFSLSVSIVVILLGGAGLTGYYYGLKQADLPSGEAELSPAGDLHESTGSKSKSPDPDASVTFYSALTEPRNDAPPVKPPQSVKKTTSPLETNPEPLPAAAPRIRVAEPGSRSVMLQVASYKDQANAKKLLDELSSSGYGGTVVRADLGERGVWFRVRIGPYGTGDTAGVLNKLRDDRKLKGFVVK